MIGKTIHIQEKELPLVTTGVAVVGSGAAALNAAVHLSQFGIKDILIVTQRMGAGTSANTGSDKQTYYRLNPTHIQGDSTLEMARDLFSGSCMHGDIALVESALSLREFYHLVNLGVPFPQNRYGDYIGFQTDHDTKARGTSAGPRTSIEMYEKLAGEVIRRKIPVLDKTEVVELLTVSNGKEKKIAGLLALCGKKEIISNNGPILIKADFTIYATGGPGALYEDSVYPPSQIGALGVALKAGVRAQNLGESQFGIASKGFRWNLSGSYQQVIPRYVSTLPDSSDEREFLNEWFPDFSCLTKAQFLKGYQWPFDVKKIFEFGSSMVDLAVIYETKIRRRRVFLDFRKNPSFSGIEFSIKNCPEIVKIYLKKSGAAGKTPVQRLKQMNGPAYELYHKNSIDLEKKMLEIAVCHQHCNGGLVGSIFWESSIKNFFPVGECNGSHGIYRPGGSALNSGQVGSLRASELIRYKKAREAGMTEEDFLTAVLPFVTEKLHYYDSVCKPQRFLNPRVERRRIQKRMSTVLGIVRDPELIEQAIAENIKMMEEHLERGISDKSHLSFFLKNEDYLITERAFLECAKRHLEKLKGGRGSYLIGKLEDFLPDQRKDVIRTDDIPDDSLNQKILEFFYDDSGASHTDVRDVRPIPQEDNWFEKVWKTFREGGIYRE